MQYRMLLPVAAALLAVTGCTSNPEPATGDGAATPAAAAAAPTPSTAQAAAPGGKQATFAARHELRVIVPAGAKAVRVWFAHPQEDAVTTVKDVKIDAPFPVKLEKTSEGDRIVYLEESDPSVREFTILETFTVTRREQMNALDPAQTRPVSDAEKAAFAKELAPNANVVINDEIRALAKQIVDGERNPVVIARKLYDWVLANIDYWVKDPKNKKASPVGSSTYCLTSKTGNCTDFHSLWTALARASGLPTRMVYGSFLKKDLDGTDRDQSYHCWPEYYVPEVGWVPNDVAVADLFVGDFATTADNEEKVRLTTADGYHGADAAKVDWYFSNLDERRVVWSHGRDVALSPAPAGGPVNALPKAYVEVDGKVHPEGTGWVRKLTYKQVQ